MQSAEKLSITLPPEMASFIRQKVESGIYGSNSEIIREAMRGLMERERRLDRDRRGHRPGFGRRRRRGGAGEEIEAVRRELRCAAVESTAAAIRPRASLSFMTMTLIAATLFKRNSNEIQCISSLYLHSATIPCPPSGDKLFIVFAFNRNREVVTQLAITAFQICECQIECW
jgi:antitoxin ParD1/3/4